MQSEFGGIYERLESAFNSHGGLIQSDIQSLTLDLNKIQEIIFDLGNSDQDLVKFLLKYKSIKYSLEQSISKPFRSDIKVQPSDLPRELEVIRTLSDKCISLEGLIEFKNEMIWKFLHDRVPTCKISKEIEEELKSWGKLADDFSKELEKYQLMCDFCGVILDNENVNNPCLKNTSYSLSIESSKYPPGFKGNTRHFFKKIPPQNIIKEDSKSVKYADVQNKVLQKISKRARERDFDVEREFKKFDILNNGFIAPTDFYYLMVEAFELNGEEITELIFTYDKYRDGRIMYQEIIKEITAKLPEPYQNLRENAGKFLDYCKKKDRLTEGAISLEQFKDVLRQLNVKADDITEIIKNAGKNNKGKILYLEFHDKII